MPFSLVPASCRSAHFAALSCCFSCTSYLYTQSLVCHTCLLLGRIPFPRNTNNDCQLSVCATAALAAGIESKPVASVLLMPGSLLVFNGEAYKDCLHGIDEVHVSSPHSIIIIICYFCTVLSGLGCSFNLCMLRLIARGVCAEHMHVSRSPSMTCKAPLFKTVRDKAHTPVHTSDVSPAKCHLVHLP